MKLHPGALSGPMLLCLALFGCHGGASSVLPSSNSSNTSQRQVMQTAGSGTTSFTVSVPASGAPMPRSLVVALVTPKQSSAMAPLVMNLSATTAGCSSTVSGNLTCVATATAPAGNDTFSITTYSGLEGTGSKLSSAEATVAVALPSAVRKTACAPKSTDIALLQSR